MKQSKFTWADTLTIIAGMIYGVITYLGARYLHFEEETVLGFSNNMGCIITSILFTLALILPAMGAKVFKRADKNFKTAIKIELTIFLIFICSCLYLMVHSPFTHYFTVYDQRKEILKDVNHSIKSTQKMFTVYEAQMNTRIQHYEHDLKLKKIANPNQYTDEIIDREVFTIKAHLFPSNFSDTINLNGIKQVAFSTLNNYRNNCLQWPAFGILEIVSKTKTDSELWLQDMISNSDRIEKYEDPNTQPFTYDNDIKNVSTLINTEKKPATLTIVYSLLVALVAIFSYLISNRSTRWPGWNKIFSNTKSANTL